MVLREIWKMCDASVALPVRAHDGKNFFTKKSVDIQEYYATLCIFLVQFAIL